MGSHRTPDWNPRDTSVLRDQRSAYDDMRERCPVAYSEFLDWSLFRHQDIVGVLADPETYSSASRHLAIPNGMDPPDHTRYRRILESYFQPERMNVIEPHCRRIAVDLVQALLAKGEVEFITEFAQPFSLTTHCVFLGCPPEDWEYLSGWTHDNQEVALSQDRELGAALARGFAGYVTEVLRIRREAGVAASDDTITSLIQSTIEGVPLNDEEIVSILRNWTAGHGTVATALGILMFYLGEHRDVQQSLRSDPTLLPVAIDEILRADGPLVINRRTTTRDVEIERRKIDAGEKLTLNWIAANRDGRTFDDPETVRFDREPGNNLLFGAGIHNCLGAPLARLEMRVAMEELLARTTTISLSNAEPPRRDIYPSNGFQVLPVHLS
ncbi:MAG: cytochrome P450 [Chloroflexota bacterium]|nr:cytochrome P450 [Chloroflexota bacterium]